MAAGTRAARWRQRGLSAPGPALPATARGALSKAAEPRLLMKLRTLLAGAALLAATAAAAQAPAADPFQGRNEWNPIDMEVSMLPPYCQVDLRPQQVRGHGTAAHGCGYRFNHFCPGLVALNRAMNPLLPVQRRRFFLQEAAGHLRYTRAHWSPQCRLGGDVQAAEQQVELVRMLLR